MLINLKKFSDQTFFDENFFLYLENDDLCIRVKIEMKIFILLKTH